jgi:hypothetical protein
LRLHASSDSATDAPLSAGKEKRRTEEPLLPPHQQTFYIMLAQLISRSSAAAWSSRYREDTLAVIQPRSTQTGLHQSRQETGEWNDDDVNANVDVGDLSDASWSRNFCEPTT